MKNIEIEAEEFTRHLEQLGYVKVIPCRDCRAFDGKKVLCKKNNMVAVRYDDWCSRAERKEE